MPSPHAGCLHHPLRVALPKRIEADVLPIAKNCLASNSRNCFDGRARPHFSSESDFRIAEKPSLFPGHQNLYHGDVYPALNTRAQVCYFPLDTQIFLCMSYTLPFTARFAARSSIVCTNTRTLQDSSRLIHFGSSRGVNFFHPSSHTTSSSPRHRTF